MFTLTVAVNVHHGRSNKRQRGTNYCNFCDATVQQLPRHLTRWHSELPEVSAVLYKSGKERKLGFLRLRNLGNFRHNISVLESGCGTLRVSKQSFGKNSKVAEDFLPCIHCFAFYCREQLWRHAVNCPFKEVNGSTVGSDGNVVGRVKYCAAGQLLLDGSLLKDNHTVVDPQFKAKVLERMRKDKVRKVCATDSVILGFGQVLFKRLGPQRALDVQQRMRQLGRLLQEINSVDGVSFQLTDVISGNNFDRVISGVHRVAGLTTHSTGRRIYKIPSLASKLGHSLKKCAEIKLGIGIRQGDATVQQQANAFLQLHGAEWQDNVSAACTVSFKLSNMNKAHELPKREDLDTLKQFQTSQMQTLVRELREQPEYESWRQLAEITLSRMTLFNKRRGGEAAQLLVAHYLERPDWQAKSNSEIVSSLMPIEKELLKRMDMVQIPGKRLNTVPILLTPDVKESMDVLLETRPVVGIPSTNPYFFPSFSTDGHLDPCQVIQRVARLAGVEKPETITTTNARKYVATMMQLFDLTNIELDWVSNHLGHSLNIHKFFYRQHTTAIEMGKVARLLLQVEEGQTADYSGKPLELITLEGTLFAHLNSFGAE